MFIYIHIPSYLLILTNISFLWGNSKELQSIGLTIMALFWLEFVVVLTGHYFLFSFFYSVVPLNFLTGTIYSSISISTLLSVNKNKNKSIRWCLQEQMYIVPLKEEPSLLSVKKNKNRRHLPNCRLGEVSLSVLYWYTR
jgi:hypothetical protein